jgi:sulfatase maturation enzyme AslB (radical SAM superfamily)
MHSFCGINLAFLKTRLSPWEGLCRDVGRWQELAYGDVLEEEEKKLLKRKYFSILSMNEKEVKKNGCAWLPVCHSCRSQSLPEIGYCGWRARSQACLYLFLFKTSQMLSRFSLSV